jgi:putative heme-binding domain-containing protein
LAHPAFVKPGHVGLVAALGEDERTSAARLFMEAAKTNPDFVWSGGLIDLLGRLPADETRPVFRSQWANLGLRDALGSQLARQPAPEDKTRFLDRLNSTDGATVVASASALNTIGDPLAPTELVQVTRALRRTLAQPAAAKSREALLALLARKAGSTFSISEAGLSAAQLPAAYTPVFEWFARAHPDLATTASGATDVDAAKWNEILAKVAWEKGDASRGEVIFRERACQTCHSGPAPIGPNLAGAASRFSPADLFAAIVFPSRDVAPAYRSTTYRLRDGQTHTGLMAFESADGVIIQTGAAATVRLPDADIVSRDPSELSLMPAGLLDGMPPEDLANLHAYLRALKN